MMKMTAQIITGWTPPSTDPRERNSPLGLLSPQEALLHSPFDSWVSHGWTKGLPGGGVRLIAGLSEQRTSLCHDLSLLIRPRDLVYPRVAASAVLANWTEWL